MVLHSLKKYLFKKILFNMLIEKYNIEFIIAMAAITIIINLADTSNQDISLFFSVIVFGFLYKKYEYYRCVNHKFYKTIKMDLNYSKDDLILRCVNILGGNLYRKDTIVIQKIGVCIQFKDNDLFITGTENSIESFKRQFCIKTL